MAWPTEQVAPPPAAASPDPHEVRHAHDEPLAIATSPRHDATIATAPQLDREPPTANPGIEPPSEPIVVLGEGVPHRILALDDATGAPIVGFGVRCASHADEARGRPTGVDGLVFALRARSEHASGVAEVTGLRPGRHLLVVEPDDRDLYAAMSPSVFSIHGPFPEWQVVRIPRAGHRPLSVVGSDGAPMAATIVELLLPLEPGAADAPTFETLALSPRRIFEQGSLPPAMLVQRVVTDANGSALLRGARHQRHVLRVLGPGHMPRLLADVALDDSPLRVEVGVGATVRGRLAPTFTLPMPGRNATRYQTWQPGLQLVDVQSAERRLPARRHDSMPLATDGTFCITGIGPGTWHLLLTHWSFEPDGSETMTTELLADVPNLAPGEERELDLTALHRERVRAALPDADGGFRR